MHPALRVRQTRHCGLGVFTEFPIESGTTLFICGGSILSLEDEDNLPPECYDKPIEISEWFSMGPRLPADIPLAPQHYINHSCDPNAGWSGQLNMVALRHISAGEEIRYDYAMVMHSNAASKTFWTMPCKCGAKNCRAIISEDDWQLPELQRKYNGAFGWHIQSKLDALAAGMEPVVWMVESGRRDGWNWVDSRVGGERSRLGGLGIFAKKSIPAKTIVVVLGGRVIPIKDEANDDSIQIADDFGIGPGMGEASASDKINHSCEGNLGFLGQVQLVTLRDISGGEELCFDYGLCLGGGIPYKMNCRCGSHGCRGVITQNDWNSIKLQRRYTGHFQWYLRRNIRLNGVGPNKHSSQAEKSQ